MAIILITGGARSGKSARAESRAHGFAGPPVYIATAEALDAEMRERIAQHRARRGNGWIEREAPLALAEALEATDGDGARLVDCLTLWLSNLMHARRSAEAEVAGLAAAVVTLEAPAIFVSNEVGLGIAPAHALGREFRDVQGRANAALAGVCDVVVSMNAGLPVLVKPGPRPNLRLA